MTWDHKVDIWSVLACWARNPAELDDGYPLAEMQAVLGSPPLKLLGRSERSHQFWDEKDPLSDFNLEALEERLKDDAKEEFLRFLRRMLCWLPEERASAKLLFDLWLMRGLCK
ncbi:unnamed protein product [Penicillium roqueforti FM164]|uniref:Genomic scaffold, ProqFM164S01 n=1 Tax=Penicillium roqueforti (strain FM164) TaxID=1365484 RepID=W6QJU9_PENRF|nr:unnamed protein product [Penicillium roqueforti FM164]